jgi:hypothetical protein
MPLNLFQASVNLNGLCICCSSPEASKYATDILSDGCSQKSFETRAEYLINTAIGECAEQQSGNKDFGVYTTDHMLRNGVAQHPLFECLQIFWLA